MLKYEDNKVNVGFTQANREQGIRRLTAINLMKRMESSVYPPMLSHKMTGIVTFCRTKRMGKRFLIMSLR